MEWLSPTTSENPMEKWMQEREGDALREECGVVAIVGDPEASRLCYLSLHALQHRGQEVGGIVTANERTLHALTAKRKERLWGSCDKHPNFMKSDRRILTLSQHPIEVRKRRRRTYLVRT